ncbi:phage terminase small subunit P27 family [Methylobacterium oryzihabitans]|uniref:Phage terminase small subunit P27 family n=1 Tax=Methylobacterium oryzihabitans TaxID=2499852 RepID=A0A3S2XL43_9HYPH|nr:phage terminase small subunit P27 family [Methylobacterium oryzihabitans]RVU17486.1 phage terminase small subunit P27 family [Methylobacterium oryzihabitans]
MRGRKPIPVEHKLTTGNPGRRPLPAIEELAKVAGEPEMPPGFDAEHAAEWTVLADDLRAASTLSREIGAVMEIYVRNLVRMRKAERLVVERGPIVEAPRTGALMQNPALAVANRAAEAVAKMAAEMGLSPSSRGRVSKVDPGEVDPADAFFN